MAKKNSSDGGKKVAAASSEYSVSVYAPGTETLTGTILSSDENLVVIRAKRPRSSKYEDHPIERSRIIAQYGTERGAEGSVIVQSERVEVDGFVGTIEGNTIAGFLTFTSEEYGTVLVRGTAAVAVAEVSDAAPKTARKSVDEAAGKKKKKKKS